VARRKDGEEGDKWAFELRVVEVGVDRDGNPITSCSVSGRGRCVSGGSLAARFGPQSSDSFEEYSAVTNRTHADFLQVLLGQVREDPFVDLVLAESRLVFFEAKAPQPDHDVHNSAPNSGLLHIIVVRGECPGGHELLVTGVTWAIRAPGGLVDTVKRISFP
jgi:hypothetical protein